MFSKMNDTSINRFVKAQENTYAQVIKELQEGKKTSHWMWFIFPQIDGLGLSPTSKYYSIKTINEAKEFMEHPILGKRLLECSTILLNHEGKSAESIFGYPDYLKLQSSMTLFNFTNPHPVVFSNMLAKYFNDKQDPKTIKILQSMQQD